MWVELGVGGVLDGVRILVPETRGVLKVKTGVSETARLGGGGRGNCPGSRGSEAEDGLDGGCGVGLDVALNVNSALDGVSALVPVSRSPPNVNTGVSEAALRRPAKEKGGAVDRAAEPKKVVEGVENKVPWLRGRESRGLVGESGGDTVGDTWDGAAGGENVKVGLDGGDRSPSVSSQRMPPN